MEGDGEISGLAPIFLLGGVFFVVGPRYRPRVWNGWFSECVRRLLGIRGVLGEFPALTLEVPNHDYSVGLKS